jgi:hypothetical protein
MVDNKHKACCPQLSVIPACFRQGSIDYSRKTAKNAKNKMNKSQSQTSNNDQIPMTNPNPIVLLTIVVWILLFIWDLEIGISNFARDIIL